jgi:predicted enzyme related to lactoylglutathione lyase
VRKRKIVHLELPAQDRLALAHFYSDLFGWDIRDFPEMDYTMLDTGNQETGVGLMPSTDDSPGGMAWYVESEDVEADLCTIGARGGTVLVPCFTVAGVGDMAFFADPAGNVMALGKFLDPA